MSLVLEIEYLLGISFAAFGPDTDAPEWPPQPDRVFSALVASWAARGRRPAERAALEWLEEQPPPLLAASAFNARPAPTVFVPPNDPATKTVGDVTVMPAFRRRQPRRFPAALPLDPTVRFVWQDAVDPPLSALDAMARDTSAVGHSASLTRCRFLQDQVDTTGLSAPRRTIYRGRFTELETAFVSGRRPSPGSPARIAPAIRKVPSSVFGTDWLTLELVEGTLDLRAAPLAAKTLRDTIMSGYGQAGLEIPTWISGHAPDGSPTREPHLVIAPLASVGFVHSDGSLLGFALVPLRGQGMLLDDTAFLSAIAGVTTRNAAGRRVMSLKLGAMGTLQLAIVLDAERRSLSPERYFGKAHCWATLTPLVLDRHLKSKDSAAREIEAETLVADACEKIGLPRPSVALHKHATIDGAPSAYPSGRAPAWTGWRLPEHAAGRRLTHATLAFEVAVEGPIVLGAGRFNGLGLCLPLNPETGR
jgi:CRISPR-associated protein Csb2